MRFGTVLAVIFELDARFCLRLLFFGIPIGTFQAFLPLILGIGDGQTISISHTSYFPCYISPRQKNSSNLFVKLRSDLRIHPRTVHTVDSTHNTVTRQARVSRVSRPCTLEVR